jgi:hypothetical protein
MVVKFSGEEIVLPQASVLSAAEKFSASVVAAINDSEPSDSKRKKQKNRQVYSLGAETKYREYLGCALSHLTLNLPTTTIVAQPFNVIKWQLKFNPVA